jgi:hypothetical protein
MEIIMETRPLTRTEIKAILKPADKPRDKALLVLGFNSGYPRGAGGLASCYRCASMMLMS